jgi:hypothetical protein
MPYSYTQSNYLSQFNHGVAQIRNRERSSGGANLCMCHHVPLSSIEGFLQYFHYTMHFEYTRIHTSTI